MRLKSVKLSHFRGYRTTTVIPIDEAMTGIVGRNDYGKSTILEALAIFFESGDVKADTSDITCFSLAEGAEQFEIACELMSCPQSVERSEPLGVGRWRGRGYLLLHRLIDSRQPALGCHAAPCR